MRSGKNEKGEWDWPRVSPAVTAMMESDGWGFVKERFDEVMGMNVVRMTTNLIEGDDKKARADAVNCQAAIMLNGTVVDMAGAAEAQRNKAEKLQKREEAQEDDSPQMHGIETGSPAKRNAEGE